MQIIEQPTRSRAQPITAPQLFAGIQPAGSRRCFYCGGQCGDEYTAREYVASSFTARDTVAGGEFVCAGCVAALNELADITLLDGTCRTTQRVRCYSWIITDGSSLAATKSHRSQLSSLCLNPPEPPYVICLSDSGQKHLLYRGVVAWSKDPATITLEGERITYKPADLAARLLLCRRVCAATGKPALLEAMRPVLLMRLVEHHLDESLPGEWLAVCKDPVTRLAAWLCPPKEECEREFPSKLG